MTSEQLLDGKAIVEIDDVHMARAIVLGTCAMRKEGRMFRVAEMLAVLREYYVRVGRDMAPKE